MISIQQLLGKDDKFFELLEASAEEGRNSVEALKQLLRHPEEGSLAEFNMARQKEKLINQQISEHVLKTFVSALEREDIEALSHTLSRIPKTIKKFAERFVICIRYAEGADFSGQVALLEKATQEVVVMVKHLRKSAHLEKIKEDNIKLQRVEGEADKLVLELLRDLYSGRHEVHKVIALKELHELLEKVIDRCRDTGNLVSHIVLKHS